MKIIKTVVLVLALITATASHADNRGSEELCHDVAESDLDVKHGLQKDPSSFKGFLRYIDDAEKNPRIKEGLRDKAYWVFNRKDLPDDLFRKLSFLRCITMVQ